MVCGLGEVGGALKSIIEGKYDTVGVDIDRGYDGECDYLHICIPYSDKFVDIVNGYIDRFQPKLTVNHSSVPIGTTKKLKGRVVHSPVRGRHPNIADCLKHYVKFVGYNDIESKRLAEEYFQGIIELRMVEDSDATEFLKMASLATYLVYLAVADEIHDAAKARGVDYNHFKEWIETQNEYINDYYDDMKWPVLEPPKGRIGGHCVMPVSEMFLNEFVSPLVLTAFSKY